MKNKELKVSEVMKILEVATPLIAYCYEFLAEKLPCEDDEINEEFMEMMEQNFVELPDWLKEELDIDDDTKFRFVLDDETDEVVIEPVDESEFCYISDEIIQNLIDYGVDLYELQDILEMEKAYEQ